MKCLPSAARPLLNAKTKINSALPGPFVLHLFRNLDRGAASELDHVREGAVERGLFRPVLQPGVVMFLLLVPEALDLVEQLLVGEGRIVHQLAQLVVVVLDNHGLDRDRARHRGLLAEQRGTGAERKAGHIPERQQGGRAHPVLVDQPVELFLVRLLLLPHVLDRFARLGVSCQYGKGERVR